MDLRQYQRVDSDRARCALCIFSLLYRVWEHNIILQICTNTHQSLQGAYAHDRIRGGRAPQLHQVYQLYSHHHQKMQYNLKNNHLGPKSSHTTRTFNLTCNHRCRVLHLTTGGPGRCNDQTMVGLDHLISGIRDSILKDLEFELLAYDKEGDIIAVKYQGVYVIVDNGYLTWSCTVPHYTVTNNKDKI